ncbi:putative HNHc nuclease [Oenococcus sp.]|uniref:putative HNHc nuclease n=1 Tax=Oenococcus sp. TaxID=1979414 RepID=UPI0039ED1F61
MDINSLTDFAGKNWLPIPETCQVCEKLGHETLATDWHHTRHAALGSMGGRRKYFEQGDQIVPLCRQHHQEIESIGIQAFISKYGNLLIYGITAEEAEARNKIHGKGYL